MLKNFPLDQEAYDVEVARHCRSLLDTHLPITSGLFFIPDHLKTQEMCNKKVDIKPRFLALAPDRLKTQEMCNKVVRREPFTLKHVQ